jgi:putative transposase
MLGFKAFDCAEATLAGIKTTHMIRKGQLHASGHTAFQQLAALAA